MSCAAIITRSVIVGLDAAWMEAVGRTIIVNIYIIIVIIHLSSLAGQTPRIWYAKYMLGDKWALRETKWNLISRWHKDMPLIVWKLLIFKGYFIEICYLASNCKYMGVIPDSGSVPNTRQAIIWNNHPNHCHVYWRIYATFGHNDLTIVRH